MKTLNTPKEILEFILAYDGRCGSSNFSKEEDWMISCSEKIKGKWISPHMETKLLNPKCNCPLDDGKCFSQRQISAIKALATEKLQALEKLEYLEKLK